MTDTIKIASKTRLLHFLTLDGAEISVRRRFFARRDRYQIMWKDALGQSRYVEFAPRFFKAVEANLEMVRSGSVDSDNYWVYRLREGQ